MRRIEWQNLISFYYLDDKNRLRNKSIMDIGADEKGVKSNEIVLILLITIFALLFFARSLTVFLVLLVSGLIIGTFALFKDEKMKKVKEFFNIIVMFLLKALRGCKFSWR